MGVFVQRARLGRLRWSDPRRISPKKAHAERASVAAYGNVALAGWVTQTSYLRYDGGRRRVFALRRSTDRGAHWSRQKRLTPRGGRVDYPQLAVAAGAAYAVWTNADSGAIRLAISRNDGKTWSSVSVGTTHAKPVAGEGFAGYPTVGASGANVVVAWFADNGGTQVAKVSNQEGSDLTASSPSVTIVAKSPHDGFHYAVARGAADGVTNHVALAYTTASGIALRTFDGSGGLGAELEVLGGSWPTQIGGRTYSGATAPSVEPFGSDGLTVVFAACRDSARANDCRSTVKGARLDVYETGSLNGGSTWTTPDLVGGVRDRGTRVNEAPGVVMIRPDKRFVLWTARDETFSTYRLSMRIGTGPA